MKHKSKHCQWKEAQHGNYSNATCTSALFPLKVQFSALWLYDASKGGGGMGRTRCSVTNETESTKHKWCTTLTFSTVQMLAKRSLIDVMGVKKGSGPRMITVSGSPPRFHSLVGRFFSWAFVIENVTWRMQEDMCVWCGTVRLAQWWLGGRMDAHTWVQSTMCLLWPDTVALSAGYTPHIWGTHINIVWNISPSIFLYVYSGQQQLTYFSSISFDIFLF